MTATRLYQFEWGGAPERRMFVVCEWLDTEFRRAVMQQVPPTDCWFSEEDLLASEQGREALAAWRRGDDSVAVEDVEDFESQRKLDAEWKAESERVIRLADSLIEAQKGAVR